MLSAEPAPLDATPTSEPMLELQAALADLEQNLQAYEAVQQIVTADSLRAESHLPTLRRESLSALLGVLNSSLRQRCGAATQASHAVSRALQLAEQACSAQLSMFDER